jgi:ring-1,2-phenylacetyl-CoA epoxidase subunit PaaD
VVTSSAPRPTRDAVLAVLAVLDTVMDPEVPVLSVRELGIVRDVAIAETGAVTVMVTPTYSGCPAIRVIEEDIVAALHEAGYADARVETVYAPAWTTDWIAPEAREKLRAYGIAPPGMVEAGGLIQLTRARSAPACPFCGSRATEIRSEFGSTACKSMCWCRECLQPFEEFKAI